MTRFDWGARMTTKHLHPKMESLVAAMRAEDLPPRST